MSSLYKKLATNSLGKSNTVLVVRGCAEDRKEDFGTPGKIEVGWEGRDPL